MEGDSFTGSGQLMQVLPIHLYKAPLYWRYSLTESFKQEFHVEVDWSVTHLE